MKKTSRAIILAFLLACVCSIPAFAGTLPSTIGASEQSPSNDPLMILTVVGDDLLSTIEGAQILDPVTGEPPEGGTTVRDRPFAGDLLIGQSVLGPDGHWHVISMTYFHDGAMYCYARDRNGNLVLVLIIGG